MRRIGFLALFVLIFTVGAVHAQIEDCPDIIQEVLESVDDLCTGMDRNSACYGASDVESLTTLDPRPDDFFTAPGDQAQLVNLREIYPQPLDEKDRTIGAAVLNVQANIPGSLPGQGVIFLLMGDARLTNQVALNSDDRTPFQSFYFLPGIGKPRCYEADPILTIQTPGNITVTIVLNGVETEMSPGTLLTITPTVCTIHRGNIIQRVGDETAVLLANQTVDIFIDDTGAVNVTGLRGISEREYKRGELIQEAVNVLAVENGWTEQYLTPPREFDVEPGGEPTVEATEEPVPEATEESTQADCDVQHTVARGETLFKIAQQYGTTVEEIVAFNQLESANVTYVGQVLCIPN